MTSEPPQNEIDSSTPTRLQKTTNDVVSWAYVRISVRHDVAVPRPTSLVAARSRPGDDETLIRIWAPSRASSCGTVRCQKSSQIADPDADAEPRRHRPQQVAGGEEPALVEQAVGRQEQLAVDVPDLAVLEQGGRDEQPVVGRLLDERDDRRQAARRGGERRPAAGRRGASRPRRRGPGAGSRSARARGRRRGRRPRRAPRRGARGAVARLASSAPSRGAIWARAIRQRLHGPRAYARPVASATRRC